MYPKPRRHKNKDYLDFVKGGSCAVNINCEGLMDAHHTKSRGAYGSDFSAIPLCRKHHREWHQLGATEFSKRTGINVYKEIAHLLQEWVLLTK